MNQTIKDRWVNALNSGNYKQSFVALRSHEGYCCLGVLCDLYIQDHENVNWVWEEYNFSMMKETGVLPPEVVEWAGLSDPNPSIRKENDIFATLAELNDNCYTFEQIADLIENQL